MQAVHFINQNFSLTLTEDEVGDVVLGLDVAEDRGSNMIEDLNIISYIISLVQTLGHYPRLQMQAVHFHPSVLKTSIISKVSYII